MRNLTRRPAALLAVGLLSVLGLTACSAPAGDGTGGESEVASAPAITVSPGARTVEVTDKLGATVELRVAGDTPTLTGVEERVADALTQAYTDASDGFIAQVRESVESTPAEYLSCEVAEGCEIPVDITLPVAEIYEGVVTLTLDQSARLGGTNRLSSPASVTLDLETGKPRPLAEFLDVADPDVNTAVEQLVRAEVDALPGCVPLEAPVSLTDVSVWSPTAAGLVLTIDGQRANLPRSCGTIRVTAPWPDAAPEAPEAAATPAPGTSAGTQATAIPQTCDELLPAADFGPLMVLTDSSGEPGMFTAEFGYGPTALNAFSEATHRLNCAYEIPGTDMFFTFSVLQLPQASRDALLAGLRDSVYTEDSYVAASGASVPTFNWAGMIESGRGVEISFAFGDNYVYTSPRQIDTLLPTVVDLLS